MPSSQASRDVRIRAGDFVSDRNAIISVFARNLPEWTDARKAVQRYDWLYLSNPVGPARAWVAEDGQTGEVVGTSTGVPKRVHVSGRVEVAFNLTDFAIDHPYRSLGPALRLLRSTLEPVNARQFAFAYEQAVGGMLAPYTRLGVQPVASKSVHVRPLRVTPVVERLCGRSRMTRFLGSVGDVALAAAASVPRRQSGQLVHALHGLCGEEFSMLDQQTAGMSSVRGVRSQDHLNWRMRRNPSHRHDILCARIDDKLAGYVASRMWETEGHKVVVIVDLLTLNEPWITRQLLRRLAAVGRDRGAVAIAVRLLDDSPAVDVFRRLGFLTAPRWLKPERTHLVVYTPPGCSSLATTLLTARNWWTFQGDHE